MARSHGAEQERSLETDCGEDDARSQKAARGRGRAGLRNSNRIGKCGGLQKAR